jgi:ketosteroid isomerase-like protein
MKQILTFSMLFALILTMYGCKQTDRDIINDPFPEAQAEVTRVLDEIYKSAQTKDIDLLSSFHAYGPKFTDFKGGESRANSDKNEQNEREFFTTHSDFKYDIQDLKVNVFGDVAIATFHGAFEANKGDQHLSFQRQGTLVFVNTEGSWKIIHEHFSPLNTTVGIEAEIEK